MTKTELLTSIRTGHTQFKVLLTELNAAQMTCPNVVGVWSVKDTLAHIIVHEQRMLDWMKVKLSGGTPTTPQPYAMPEAELNLLNEQIYQGNRDRALEAILTELETAHQQSLDLVETAVEADLFTTQRFALHGGESLWEAVAANTFEHYAEHGRDIRAWMENQIGARQ